MFKKFFGKSDQQDTPKTPEVMGLRLGGAFELDELKLKIIQPKLIIDGAAKTHFIQAVGEVKLDEDTTALRFYTDDEGFLQVLLSGGMEESHVSDVKLWYYYDTQGVGSNNDWDSLLNDRISTPSINCEGHIFERVWQNTGDSSPPVAMTEKTYQNDSDCSETDQFMMLYERQVEPDLFEYVSYAGEEKIIENQHDRCFVICTGFDIQSSDISIIG